MDKIIQEKISADHLLYVSLKYTKTTEVILNLIARWRSMIEIAIERLLENSLENKKIKSIPETPIRKIEAIKESYKRNKTIIDTIKLYEFFRRINNLEKIKENDFRKNVTLKVLDKGEWINIDMEKLKEYSEIIDKFVNEIRKIL